MSDLSKISAPLDPGIKDAVELLREADIDTTASCDGKHDGKDERPWIRVNVPDESHFFYTRNRISLTLIRAKYHGFTIDESRLYQKDFNPWKTQIRITFWGEAKPEQ